LRRNRLVLRHDAAPHRPVDADTAQLHPAADAPRRGAKKRAHPLHIHGMHPSPVGEFAGAVIQDVESVGEAGQRLVWPLEIRFEQTRTRLRDNVRPPGQTADPVSRLEVPAHESRADEARAPGDAYQHRVTCALCARTGAVRQSDVSICAPPRYTCCPTRERQAHSRAAARERSSDERGCASPGTG
jgi:hypothetical protein